MLTVSLPAGYIFGIFDRSTFFYIVYRVINPPMSDSPECIYYMKCILNQSCRKCSKCLELHTVFLSCVRRREREGVRKNEKLTETSK